LNAEIQSRLPFADQAFPDNWIILDNWSWIRHFVLLQGSNHLLDEVAARGLRLRQNGLKVHFV
jgi:hypothetical protein